MFHPLLLVFGDLKLNEVETGLVTSLPIDSLVRSEGSLKTNLVVYDQEEDEDGDQKEGQNVETVSFPSAFFGNYKSGTFSQCIHPTL